MNKEERERWQADFEKRLEDLESSSFPKMIAGSAFDVIFSELCQDGSSEFSSKPELPDPEWVARKAWEFADAMNEERKKRGY